MSRQHKSSYFIQFGFETNSLRVTDGYCETIEFDFESADEFQPKFLKSLTRLNKKISSDIHERVLSAGGTHTRLVDGLLQTEVNGQWYASGIIQLVKVHDHLACEPFRG